MHWLSLYRYATEPFAIALLPSDIDAHVNHYVVLAACACITHTHPHIFTTKLSKFAPCRIATHALNLLLTLICYLRSSPSADRFRADDMLQDSREDCYLSTLHILHTDEHDSRPYYLVVENERGTDRHAIHLNVEGTFTGAE